MKSKLELAIDYLKSRNIWRGQARCNHRYITSTGAQTDPGKKFKVKK